MMHVRHVTMADDEDGGDGISRSPTRRSSSITKTKIGMKKDPLQGSLHSETTTETKQKRRNSLQSQKSHNSQTSRNSLESKGLDEFGQNSHRFNGSTNFHASHQFNASVQQFHGSTTFSGSSVASKQSQFSSAENVPATPNHSGASRGSVGRKKSSSVPSTPISHMSSTTSSSAKHSPKVLRKGNPQTPPGAATPTTNPARRKLKKKPAEEGNGTTERSTSTRTSYITNNSSLNDSQHRHQFSSDDEGVRPKGSPVKKRRPKVAGEPVSPLRRSSTIVMTPSSPQVTGHHHSGSPDSPVSASPSAKGRRLIKKKKPVRKTDDTEPQRRSTFRTMSQRTDDGGNDVFYSSSDDMERGLSTDDEDYQVAPRQTPRPVRRMKKKPIRASSEPQTPLQHSKAQVSYDHIPETPAGQREVPSHIGRTPVRSASMVSTSDEEMRIAPSRRTSFDTHFTHTSAMTNGSTSNTTKLYEHARRCQWDDVMREVEANPRDAKTVGEKDGTTALHLAVMSRTNPMMRDGRVGEFKPAPLELIEMLVKACPEAASTRCTRKRYTPLAYACLVADHGYDMDDCSEMVLILLKHAPGSVFVFTDDGFSAVDIHILSYSQIHKQKEEVYSGGRTSTVVLRTLLAEQPDLAESRVYKHKVRGPIELLYRCNTSEFQDAMIDDLTGDASDVKKKQLKSRFGSVASVLSDWWAWKWVLLLLKFSTIKDKKPGTIFSAVQAAARLVACPLPILALAINTFPHQVEERDPRGDIYNLPLHEVCSWRADEAIISGDPFVAGRKLKAIQLLLNEYPDAARMTNNMGETPLQLAIETCTPWHGGLELLVESCPKALKFPRKLRMGDQGLCLSVLNPSALDSVASYDSDEQDPMAAMEGMYPFALSAVLGGVAKNKRRVPLDYTEEQKEQHLQQLAQKDLQAVRSVYGLLRSRPDVLEKYRKDVTRDYLRMLKEMEND